MHDQHMTPERWVGSTVHVGAVGDEPQTDSRSGAVRSVYDDRDGVDWQGENTSAPVDLEDGTPTEDTAADDADFDDVDTSQPYVPPAVKPAPPFLSLVGGFDETFDSIEDQWQERALCAQTDPEAFFPEKGGSTREAKRICLGCEVKDECLEYALAHDERFGIWGGLSERERRRLKRGII